MKVTIIFEFDVPDPAGAKVRTGYESGINSWQPILEASEFISLGLPELRQSARPPEIRCGTPACELERIQISNRLPDPQPGILPLTPPARFPILTLNCTGSRRWWAVTRSKEDWNTWQAHVVGWWPLQDPNEDIEGIDITRRESL